MEFIAIEDIGSELELLTLHGTGGTERDLVSIAQELAPGASILSPRGRVNESGMNRWFKRFAEGVFDEASIREEAAAFAEYLQARSRPKLRIALGYSNGANMGAAMLLLYPELLDGLVMWRGMFPIQPEIEPDLSGKKVLMLNGSADPMAPLDSAQKLNTLLKGWGAVVEQRILPVGHGLTQSDFLATQEWLSQLN